ncbi:MAG: macro domain-containing protein [Bacilli bacterium]
METIEDLIEYLESKDKTVLPKTLPLENQLYGMMALTLPFDLSKDYYLLQDRILIEERRKREVVLPSSLPFRKGRIRLFSGDITTLLIDAIVCPGNKELLGCFIPNHNCLDNQIHTRAGLEVRRDLLIEKERRGSYLPGDVVPTKGYCIPCTYIFHVLGPQIQGKVPTEEEKEDLGRCYRNCLVLAEREKISSIAFPAISTGVFGFPKKEACFIAVSSVRRYLEENPSTGLEQIVFSVFGEEDKEYYEQAIL